MAVDPATSAARADHLRTTALSFAKNFGAGLSGPECLDKFFTSNPKITEYGPHFATERLPFLAVKFTGRRRLGQSKAETCDDYYDLLTSTLALVPGTLNIPNKQEIAVDGERGIVTVRLRAKFKSIKTGKAWEEEFVYVLSEFDSEGRIGRQELWADPLSAWLAVGDRD